MARVLVVIALLASNVAYAESPDQAALRLVNSYRAAVGLPAVKLDGKLSKGCMEHAEYMRLNKDSEAMVGLNAHKQRPGLPGATAAGAECAKAADLFPGVANLEVAIAGWMAGLYHRRPILAPTLERIGVGYAALPDGSLMAALMFVDGKGDAPGWPVRYPADKQRDVPLELGLEVPNPVPAGKTGGYPITLQFPAFDKVTGVAAKLVDDAGKAVPFYLSDPEHPATSFGQYGVVCLIAKQPLRAGARYDVTIQATWNGKAVMYAWRFATIALRAVDGADEDAVLKAINVPSRVRGTVAYGGMMDSATAFLMIGRRDTKRYKMLSVLIPVALWKQLARGAAPDKAFAGKTLEIEATPVFVQNTYVNLPISVASQFHVVN
jgi:cysteine-rich secretory family protein